MEQIVKIFVHQCYYIENDLVVDYNVEQGALANTSHLDWIALIPKGWSGVDDQVAFKNIDTDCDGINLAIKSITIEKKCFQNVVECEKYYQLMYISQHLEILGRSEYFLFLHKSNICNCSVSSTKKADNKEISGKNKLSSTFNHKIVRRQSPTPHEFYKHRPQSQNNVKSEKSKHLSSNNCIKCNASTDFAANESVYLAKIQDLTINNEKMEKYLMKLETDLTNTLEVLNKLFKLNKTISQQKDDIQKFIDDVVDGLLKDGKVTFWARDQEFSVVREFPEENQISLLQDDISTILPINKSFNSLNEEWLKAIIGQQEQTIQNLVNKIKELLEIFVKVNMQSAEQNSSALTISTNKISNIGYTDIKGTTYFSPAQCIANKLDDVSLYLPNNHIKKCIIENFAINTNMCNGSNNEMYDTKYPDTRKYKAISKLNNGVVEDKTLTLEKNYENEYTTEKLDNSSLIPEKSNELKSIEPNKNDNFAENDDSL